jgi:hypothetical protein
MYRDVDWSKEAIEVRIPKGAPATNKGDGRPHSGWCRSVDDIVDCVESVDGSSTTAVYATLNPCTPDALSYGLINWQSSSGATGDKDITRRINLLVDIDPTRPANTSATDDEITAARSTANNVLGWLTEAGWPSPLVAGLSGNGCHIIYRIDLPNDEGAEGLVKSVLHAMDYRWSDEKCRVDTSVSNASRISKLYGTWARKGADSVHRPHRLATTILVDGQAATVSREMLRVIADKVPLNYRRWWNLRHEQAKAGRCITFDTVLTEADKAYLNNTPTPRNPSAPTRGTCMPRQPFAVETWIEGHGVEVLSRCDDMIYVRCPWSDEHTSGETARESAIIVQESGALAYKCFHSHCEMRGWQEYRAHYDPDYGARINGAPTATSQPGGMDVAWSSADDPDAFAPRPVEPSTSPASVHVHSGGSKPWQTITTADIKAAIAGTRVETIVTAIAAVTDPPMPLEMTLGKALAVAGVALTQPKPGWKTYKDETDAWGSVIRSVRGTDWLKLKIMTAGGQGCHVWSLTVAESATGKDIGGVVNRLAADRGWLVSGGGSAEGLKDSFADKGSGLIFLGELQPYLDPHRWQYACTPFLTSSFGQGWFADTMSKRGKSGESKREARFCFPSILANVQPAILQHYGDSMLSDSGFLPRFLFSVVPEWAFNCRPTVGEIDTAPAMDALLSYAALEGTVTVRDRKYLQHVLDSFTTGGAAIGPHYRRLVNEYGPRFAVMVARDPLNPEPEAWDRAAALIWWHYGMAEGILTGLQGDVNARRMTGMVDRYLAWMKREARHDLVSYRAFSQRFWRGATATDRKKALEQMENDGMIEMVNGATGGQEIRVL